MYPAVLQKDRLGIVFVHEPEMQIWEWDEKTLDASVIQALEKLKQERIVGAIGLGINSVEFPGKVSRNRTF